MNYALCIVNYFLPLRRFSKPQSSNKQIEFSNLRFNNQKERRK